MPARHQPELQRLVGNFEDSLSVLRSGDASRPLFVPWDDAGAPAVFRGRVAVEGAAPAVADRAGIAGGNLAADGRRFCRGHRPLCAGHRAAPVAADRHPEPVPVRHDGAGHRRRGDHALHRLPVRDQSPEPASAGAGQGGSRGIHDAHRRRYRGRVRPGGGRLQPHGRNPGVDVQGARIPGRGQDPAHRGAARAAGGAV